MLRGRRTHRAGAFYGVSSTRFGGSALPFTIPPFQQYQGVMVPLRGLWNRKPPEGDRFVSAEIDWLTPGINNCVQFQLSGNTPVPMSQIAALYVDNARCGSDVTFLFGDSGFLLVIPAYAEGLYPVLTNALMFYCSAPSAAAADVTVLQILNSIPPTASVQLGQQQQSNNSVGINLAAAGTTQIVPLGVSGTLNAFTITLTGVGAGGALVYLQDGTGRVLWGNNVVAPAGATQTLPIVFNDLKLRFNNGLVFIVAAGTTLAAGSVGSVNVFYSIP